MSGEDEKDFERVKSLVKSIAAVGIYIALVSKNPIEEDAGALMTRAEMDAERLVSGLQRVKPIGARGRGAG